MKSSRTTFDQLCQTAKRAAAESAWQRAKAASKLRHLMIAKRRYDAASKLADIKREALALAIRLLPLEVHVTIDSDYQVGLLSIRWRGHGRMHLPADCLANLNTSA